MDRVISMKFWQLIACMFLLASCGAGNTANSSEERDDVGSTDSIKQSEDETSKSESEETKKNDGEKAIFRLTRACDYIRDTRPIDYCHIFLFEDYSCRIEYKMKDGLESVKTISYEFEVGVERNYFANDYIVFRGDASFDDFPIDFYHHDCLYSRGGDTIKTQSQGIPQPISGKEYGYVTSVFSRTALL